MRKRSIIVHFHFFKNAGTSVETILRQNFRRRFRKRYMVYEPGAATQTFPASVLIPVLHKNKEIKAISSHTICFPPPKHNGWDVFPLVFIRHPLDRILSMYHFEKQQKIGTAGAKMAKDSNAADYILSRLNSQQERTLRNYQAWMLAGKGEPGMGDAALLSAASAVINELAVVGVVDQFARSIELMSKWLEPSFPGLDMKPVHRQRISPMHTGLNDRIQHLNKMIGDDVFRRIKAENEVDIELYRLASDRLSLNGMKSE